MSDWPWFHLDRAIRALCIMYIYTHVTQRKSVFWLLPKWGNRLYPSCPNISFALFSSFASAISKTLGMQMSWMHSTNAKGAAHWILPISTSLRLCIAELYISTLKTYWFHNLTPASITILFYMNMNTYENHLDVQYWSNFGKCKGDFDDRYDLWIYWTKIPSAQLDVIDSMYGYWTCQWNLKSSRIHIFREDMWLFSLQSWFKTKENALKGPEV